jgi:hypothetical protein
MVGCWIDVCKYGNVVIIVIVFKYLENTRTDGEQLLRIAHKMCAVFPLQLLSETFSFRVNIYGHEREVDLHVKSLILSEMNLN